MMRANWTSISRFVSSPRAVPANSDRLANVNYFVAVARSDRTVLARRSFDIAIPFPGNRTRVSGLEEIGQIITLAQGEDGSDYLIYLGFDLTAGRAGIQPGEPLTRSRLRCQGSGS